MLDLLPSYDKNRAEECFETGQDQYNSSWGFVCTDAGHTEKECGDAINNPVDLGTHAQLEEQNRRSCYDSGFKDGNSNSSLVFNKDRDNACSEYSDSYGDGFMAGCESTGNTDDNCELTIEGHELYCPNNPDDPACTEFLHNATNKKPAEICGSPSGCFKDQDAEKYCLNYNDTTFCKIVGDICDAGSFVKPEDAYCK